MARIRKLRGRAKDGDSVFSLSADKGFPGGELFVVGSGRRAYFTVHCGPEDRFAAFSGTKTLRKLAQAILKATS